MIYIDPPYNTGSDFIYRDNLREPLRAYQEQSGEYKEGKRQSTNRETEGRYHSNWLKMMYPRLSLARDLLREDGVIFISIDDNEVANLKHICNEIFGEENFVGDLIRKTKSTTNDVKTGFNIQHDNTLIFVKNKNKVLIQGQEKTFDNYKNPDDDPNGEWLSDNPSASTGSTFEIINPYTKKIDLPPKGREWQFSEKTFQEHIKSGKIVFKKEHKENERGFIFKRYKNEVRSDFKIVNSLDLTANEYMNQVATKEIISLMEEKYFSYPKPIKVIKYLLSITAVQQNDIVLDFFAGSGTTGQAVMELNKEKAEKGEEGSLKYILVQLPETIDSKEEAYRAGYRTIDEITKARLIKAKEKIQTEIAEIKRKNALNANFNSDKLDSIDLNFTHLKLSQTHFLEEEYDYNSSIEEQAGKHNLALDSNIKVIIDEDILLETLIRCGKLDKFNEYQKITIANFSFYKNDEDYICIAKEIKQGDSKNLLLELLKIVNNIATIVFIEQAFANDSVKSSLYSSLKSYNSNIIIKELG